MTAPFNFDTGMIIAVFTFFFNCGVLYKVSAYTDSNIKDLTKKISELTMIVNNISISLGRLEAVQEFLNKKNQ